jgi:hypothetical protein
VKLHWQWASHRATKGYPPSVLPNYQRWSSAVRERDASGQWLDHGFLHRVDREGDDRRIRLPMARAILTGTSCYRSLAEAGHHPP